MLTEIEAYAARTLDRDEVPGAAIAVVQHGRMIYSKGFGVTLLGSGQPVTADTRFLFGSLGKGMTAQMIGTLVDDGIVTWDTQIVDVLPEFTLAEPTSTATVTFRDLLSMGSGLPRFDAPLLTAPRNPAAILGILAETPLLGAPGEAYGYSNSGYTAAGFAAANTRNPAADDLMAGYVQLMQSRFFGPTGMRRTTTDFEIGANDPNHASPHAVDSLTADVVAIPLAWERIGSSVLPAGGTTWSSVEDVAAYLALQLRRGVGPDGRRIVSEASLLETWQPHTPTGNGDHFGLGWIVGPDYHGLRQLSYSGGNLGFSSRVSFLPEADLGVAVLTNASLPAIAFLKSVPEYVYETALGLPHTADAEYAAEGSMIRGIVREMASTLEPGVASPAFTAVAGHYGPVLVRLDDESRPEISTAFGDFLLYPVTGRSDTYAIESLLSAVITFEPTPEGGMALIVNFVLGEPQPAFVVARTE
jgi:CubicO group peptidase (beta-lactamase class C family)